MSEPVAEGRSVCVGGAVVEEEDDDARAATCIVVGIVVVAATENVGVVADGTSVHPSRDLWDQSEDVVDGMGTADSRDTEASRLVPMAAQEEEDRVDTESRDCIPSVGDRCIGVGHKTPAGVRKVKHRRRTEKWSESCENCPRC